MTRLEPLLFALLLFNYQCNGDMPNSTTKPTSWSTNKPTTRSTNNPTSWSTNKPTIWSSHKPTSWPTTKPTSWSTNKPTTWSTNKPTSWSTNKPPTWSSHKPTSWPTAKPTSWSTTKLTSWSTTNPTSWSTNKPTLKTTPMPTLRTIVKSTLKTTPKPIHKTTPKVSTTRMPRRTTTRRSTRTTTRRPTRKTTRRPTRTTTRRPTRKTTSPAPTTTNNLEEKFSWKMLDFSFPTEAEEKAAVAKGSYVQKNGVPIDVQPHYQKNKNLRTFVTIPRFQSGVPYTLATLTDKLGPNGPMLEAYPSHISHNVDGDDCDKITSAFRVATTECNQMWVMDSGSIGVRSRCPPQLLLYDLNTDQLLHRYKFNGTVYTPSASLFVTPIVVVKDPPPKGECTHAMVYVADVKYHGLVIYDHMANSSWRIEHKFMYPDPDFGTLTIAEETFSRMDGIIGLTTVKRDLYFHAMSSCVEFSVPLKVLDNSTNFINGGSGVPGEFVAVGKRNSACVATATDSRDNVYCVTFEPIELISWNVNTPYNNKSFKKLSINPKLLEFVSGMKVVTNNEGQEELWMMSNRYQKVAAGTLNRTEVNFRIVVYNLGSVRERW